MKRFACGDIVPDCDATFEGSTDDEILGAVAEHASAAHGIETVPPELVEQIRGKITGA